MAHFHEECYDSVFHRATGDGRFSHDAVFDESVAQRFGHRLVAGVLIVSVGVLGLLTDPANVPHHVGDALEDLEPGLRQKAEPLAARDRADFR